MRCILTTVMTLLASVYLAGCRGTEEAGADDTGPTAPDAPTRLTVEANNRFACDLLRQLAKERPGSNQFFSPLSISAALAIALEGAQGQTAFEMGQVLRLPDDLRGEGDKPWNLDAYHAGFATLLRRYAAAQTSKKNQPVRDQIAQLRQELNALNAKVRDEGDYKTARDLHAKAVKVAATINELQRQVDLFELNLANAVWAEKSYPISKEFEKTIAHYYGTGAFRFADFINQFPAERARINRWVETQTKDKIGDSFPELQKEQARLVRMIVVNAIYFKGQWNEPFSKDRTTNQPFMNAPATKTNVPLMARYGQSGYAAFNGDGSYFATPHFIANDKPMYPDDGGFQVAELRYKGDRLAMTVLLPRSGNGLPSLEAKLTGENLEKWLPKIEKRTVDLALPKFRTATKYSLGEQLQSMGMKQAFSLGANFHGIAKPSNPNDDLHISHVLHDAFIEVNEEGTEAAAASAIAFEKKSEARIERPFIPTFRADHPFLYLIRDTESGAILFVGRMATAAPK